ncbi:HK97 gp10 family phage protein [Cutibacterium sp. WCA-380-WT-3A]|uniref:HK97 gp10 family phage protein n=1 Tax=Cutibacterium porci TaxID=2605781 RepID=A0A7K0J5Z5_9ACTN|nr:HK97-gp10 family putative phage morphogenesis protein [Cutibacterium porci]MSS45332.1 HK97 gp10 family phage protein [Cutibacterium porci]
MARMQINRFLDSLQTVSTAIEACADEVLHAGARIVEARMRSNLQQAIGQGQHPSRPTGQLLSTLGITSVKVNSGGDHNIKVGFAENRTDGRSNAHIANVLEHGRSNQPAHPFLAPTRSQTRAPATKQALAARISQVQP